MADIKPIGTATTIAMKEISRVPVNRGTAPKAPEEPTWSARIAICGLQRNPKRKSVTGTFWKNKTDSNTTESTMPTVVKIAIVEQAIRKTIVPFSTLLRARCSTSIWR